MTARYTRDVSWAASAQVVGGTAAALYIVVAARWLGPADFGLFQAFMALYAVLMSGGALFGWLALHRVASAAPQERCAALAAVLRVAAFVGMLGGALVIAAAPVLSESLRCSGSATIWILAVLVTMAFVLTTLYGGIQGHNRYACYAGVKSLESLVFLSVGSALLMMGGGVGGALAGYTVAMTVAVVVLLLRCRKRPTISNAPGAELPRRPATTLLAMYVTIFFVINAPAVIARARLPEDQAGLFGVLYAMRNVVVPFALAAGMPLYTHRLIAGPQPGRLPRAIALVTGVGVVLPVVGWWCPEWVLTVLFGDAYVGAASYMAAYGGFLLLHCGMMVVLMQAAAAGKLPVGILIVPLLVTSSLVVLPDLNIARIIMVQSLSWIVTMIVWPAVCRRRKEAAGFSGADGNGVPAGVGPSALGAEVP